MTLEARLSSAFLELPISPPYAGSEFSTFYDSVVFLFAVGLVRTISLLDLIKVLLEYKLFETNFVCRKCSREFG